MEENKKKYPKKYMTKDKKAMKDEIGKHAKKSDSDKSAYGKWPADYKGRNTKSGERYETKKSAATKAYEKKYGKKNESLNEDEKSDKALKNKSEDSGIPVGILKQVYNRGMAAWKTGHRPGTAQGQWAMGRVNSFITGSGGARKADSDLWSKAKKSKEKKKKKNESFTKYIWDTPVEKLSDVPVSDDLQYHLDNNLPLGKSVFRYGSDKFASLINEARELFESGHLELNENDSFIVNEFSGEKAVVENKGEIILDFIYEDFDTLDEAEYKGKKVQLNKPKRGGSKKFYVYVKDPKSGNIKKVSFGAKSGGGNLAVKLKDPKARKAFADRHNCDQKNDKTSPGYWSCRLPRYAKLLGLSGGGTWW